MSWIILVESPRLIISATSKSLSSSGNLILFLSSSVVLFSENFDSRENFEISRDLIPFKSASSKEEPIAMTSPVAIIFVPSFLFANLNLSKGHLGIFTTT